MSLQDVDTARAALERFIGTGEPAWDLMREDVEVYDHDIMDGGAYRGREGIMRWLADWSAAWSDFSMEPEELIDGGDCVIAFIHMRATGASSGIEVDRQDAMLYRFRDGKIASLDYFNTRGQALAAAGL